MTDVGTTSEGRLLPGVSVLTTTYDRADVLGRAIESVLAQDTPDWELVVVDNGSNDGTWELLQRYDDPRITRLRLEVNRGCTGGRNICLDHIGREWFTFLDSDDYLLPHALSTLLAVPREVDPRIDAITCNSLDSLTGEFTGLGLDHDQWLDARTVMTRCSGEFWGITKTSLLRGRRFNEKIQMEGLLWSKLDREACRYYVHQGLCVYNTERGDRESVRQDDDALSCYPEFVALFEEEREFLADLAGTAPTKYSGLLFRAFCIFLAAGDRERAAAAFNDLRETGRFRHRMVARAGLAFGPRAIDSLRHVRDAVTGR